MAAQSDEETLLGGLRVLDLADERGLYCTKLLADLGADVIKVEKPGGDATRNIVPFWHDIPHPEKSLYFAYLNTNKRGITLNLESVDGQDIFKRLVKGADIVIETHAPGYLDSIGLGYSTLKKINPGLVMTSITGFGQTGPYKDFKCPEIVGFAMGGYMFLTGDPAAPPVQAGALQMYNMTALTAAVVTLIALYYRNMTGIGQQVDVSMQECIASLLEFAAMFYSYDGVIQKRVGSGHPTSVPCGIYRCKDGYFFPIIGNPQNWNQVITWMIRDGLDVGDFLDPKWENTEVRGTKRKEIDELISKWAMKYTRDELLRESQKLGMPSAAVFTLNETAEDPQLKARNYFIEIEHPLMGSFKYPGPSYKLSEMPWTLRRPSPLIGQENEKIYGELGFSKEELVTLKGAGVI